MSLAELTRAHAAFPELAVLAAELRAGWAERRFTVGTVEARIVEGDARDCRPGRGGRMPGSWTASLRQRTPSFGVRR